jgi:hypothetical protein
MFYRRLFCAMRPSILNTIILTLVAIVVAWVIGFLVLYCLSCGSNIDALFQGDIPYVVYCLNLIEKFEEGYAISDFILDSLILLIPLPSVRTSSQVLRVTLTGQIWGLHLTPGRKLGVTAIFMLALMYVPATSAIFFYDSGTWLMQRAQRLWCINCSASDISSAREQYV